MRLDVSKCCLTAGAASELLRAATANSTAAESRGTSLKELILCQNGISDDVICGFADNLMSTDAIAKLDADVGDVKTGSGGLIKLDLANNSIGARGARALCKALEPCHDDGKTSRIVRMPQLELLVLGGNSMDGAGKEAAAALQSTRKCLRLLC